MYTSSLRPEVNPSQAAVGRREVLVPDLALKREELFLRFINEAGVLDQLIGIVERVKAEGGANKNASSSLDSTNISLDSVKSFQAFRSSSPIVKQPNGHQISQKTHLDSEHHTRPPRSPRDPPTPRSQQGEPHKLPPRSPRDPPVPSCQGEPHKLPPRSPRDPPAPRSQGEPHKLPPRSPRDPPTPTAEDEIHKPHSKPQRERSAKVDPEILGHPRQHQINVKQSSAAIVESNLISDEPNLPQDNYKNIRLLEDIHDSLRNLRLTDITSSDSFNNNGSMLPHISEGADTSSVHHQAASLEEASCTNTQREETSLQNQTDLCEIEKENTNCSGSVDSLQDMIDKLKNIKLAENGELEQSNLKPKPSMPYSDSNVKTSLSRQLKPLLSETDLKGQASLPETNLKAQASLPETNLKSQAFLPETDLKFQAFLHETNLKSQASLPETNLASQALLPETFLKSKSSLPQTELKSQSSLTQTELKSQSSLPDTFLKNQPSGHTISFKSPPSVPEISLKSQPSVSAISLQSQPAQQTHSTSQFLIIDSPEKFTNFQKETLVETSTDSLNITDSNPVPRKEINLNPHENIANKSSKETKWNQEGIILKETEPQSLVKHDLLSSEDGSSQNVQPFSFEENPQPSKETNLSTSHFSTTDSDTTARDDTPSPPRESTPLPNQSKQFSAYCKDFDIQPHSNSQLTREETKKPAHSRTLAKLLTRKHNKKDPAKDAQVQVHVECTSDCDHTLLVHQIPAFYRPHLPISVLPAKFIISIQEFFNAYGGKLNIDDCGDLCIVLGLPFYLRTALFSAFDKDLSQTFSCTEFLGCYQAKAVYLMGIEEEEMAFNLITNFGRQKVVKPESINKIIEDIIWTDPSLRFFRTDDTSPEMKMCYRSTVLESVLYAGDGWSRRTLSLKQFKQSNFVECLNQVHEKEDISMVDHFSYDQFYVLYVRFLTLDVNKDHMLDKSELINYDDNRLITELVVNRIFAVNLQTSPNGLMSFEDFVIFVKADVDKTTASSIHYWFNILDLDCDGYLGLDDLRTFYLDSVRLFIYMDADINTAAFNDIIDQLIDSTYPGHHYAPRACNFFSLSGLRRNSKVGHLLDAFVNGIRFLQNDESPEAVNRARNSPWLSYLEESLQDLETDF